MRGALPRPLGPGRWSAMSGTARRWAREVERSEPMSERFRMWLAQLNPTVGDLAANADTARAAWEKARDAGADMIAFPEMFLTGYQLQDLVKKPAFAMDVHRVMGELCRDLHRRSGHRDRRPAARRGQAVQRLLRASGRRNLGDRAQAPPAELQRLRRKALLPFGRPGRPGARRSASYRRADLRGRVVRGRDRNAGRDRGRDPAGPQWLPLPSRQNGCPPGADGGPRGRDGAAAGLPEPLGRTGRPGLRRGELRSEPPMGGSPTRCRPSRRGCSR